MSFYPDSFFPLIDDILLIIFQFAVETCCTSPQIIYNVCHHWRELAMCKGALWTNIFVTSAKSKNSLALKNHYKGNQQICRNVEELSKAIDCCNHSTLTVECYSASDKEEDSSTMPDMLSKLLSARVLPQIQHLDLTYLEPMPRRVHCSTTISAIKTLYLPTFHLSQEPIQPWCNTLLHGAQNLSYLSLSRLHAAEMANQDPDWNHIWPSLQRLETNSDALLCKYGHLMVNLTSIGPIGALWPSYHAPITTTFLKITTISGIHTSPCHLPRLNLPSLQYLYFIDTGKVLERLTEIVCYPKLEHLKFSTHATYWLPLIKAPQLKQLTYISSQISPCIDGFTPGLFPMALYCRIVCGNNSELLVKILLAVPNVLQLHLDSKGRQDPWMWYVLKDMKVAPNLSMLVVKHNKVVTEQHYNFLHLQAIRGRL